MECKPEYSMVVAGLVAAAPMATSSKLSTKSGTSSSPAEVAPAPTLAPAEALLLANSLAIFFNCVISCGPNCDGYVRKTRAPKVIVNCQKGIAITLNSSSSFWYSNNV
uniref:Uncharacterized protein n=1 Tax=Glossina pallidipes TaxID=7398 RepID=A0A1A9Z7M4_GLOPL